MLTDHRRALWYAIALLASLGFVLFAVGKHPASLAPLTTLRFVGRFDQQMYNAVDDIRVTPLTWLFRFLNVVGGGIVTIPLRAIASIYLLVRRWWRRAAGFMLDLGGLRAPAHVPQSVVPSRTSARRHRRRRRLFVPFGPCDRGRGDGGRAGARVPAGGSPTAQVGVDRRGVRVRDGVLPRLPPRPLVLRRRRRRAAGIGHRVGIVRGGERIATLVLGKPVDEPRDGGGGSPEGPLSSAPDVASSSSPAR